MGSVKKGTVFMEMLGWFCKAVTYHRSGHVEFLWLACDAVDAINNITSQISPEINTSGEPIFLSSN